MFFMLVVEMPTLWQKIIEKVVICKNINLLTDHHSRAVLPAVVHIENWPLHTPYFIQNRDLI